MHTTLSQAHPDYWTVTMINFQSHKKKEFPNKKKEFTQNPKKKEFSNKKKEKKKKRKEFPSFQKFDAKHLAYVLKSNMRWGLLFEPPHGQLGNLRSNNFKIKDSLFCKIVFNMDNLWSM